MKVTMLLVLVTALLGCAAATEVICYWGSWSHYRTGAGTVTAEDLDPHLCTIYIYSFAKLSPSTYTMEMYDTWLDDNLQNYQRFMSLKQKNPALKLLIALGGWNDSLHPKYSIMLANPALRENFVATALQFVQQHGFDGLDLDYEYPTAADRPYFTALVSELRAAFAPHGLMLSAAVPTHSFKIDAGYDVPAVAQQLDFINVMAYDMHGPWEASADNHAAFRARASDAGNGLDLQSVMSAWMSRGAPASKLAMGIPLYGKTWTVPGPQKAPPAAGTGAGHAGPYTREAGTLSYLEICEKVNAGWTVVTDPSGTMGPYAYSGDQWVAYDDKAMVAAKTQWAVSQGFGAVMVWYVSYEDVRNTCGGGTWPLMSTILKNLGSNGTSTTTTTTTTTTTPASKTTTTTTANPATATTSKPSGDPTLLGCSGGSAGGVVPNPADCSSYFLCGGEGAAHPFQCPAGTLFDPSLLYCNWASLVTCSTSPEASTTSTTPATTTTTKATTTTTKATTTTTKATTTSTKATTTTAAAASTPASPGSFICPGEEGWFADPADCHSYYKCLNSRAYRATCPAGTGWHQSINSCNWASIVGCA